LPEGKKRRIAQAGRFGQRGQGSGGSILSNSYGSAEEVKRRVPGGRSLSSKNGGEGVGGNYVIEKDVFYDLK